MEKAEVAIATISWARNEQEEALLRRSLEQLATLDVPIFITDGGSGESFLQFLRSHSNFTLLEPAKGLWPQTKGSLVGAYESGAKSIFYTEPDKADFFTHHLPKFIHEVSFDEQTGVVLAARSLRGFGSFPQFQQMTETTINNCCEEIIGEAFDYVYGPFLLNSELIAYLKDLTPNIGWGWRPYTFNIAKRLGLRVTAISGDFLCPPDQQHDDHSERLHRMRQLAQNIEGLTLSTSATLD